MTVLQIFRFVWLCLFEKQIRTEFQFSVPFPLPKTLFIHSVVFLCHILVSKNDTFVIICFSVGIVFQSYMLCDSESMILKYDGLKVLCQLLDSSSEPSGTV